MAVEPQLEYCSGLASLMLRDFLFETPAALFDWLRGMAALGDSGSNVATVSNDAMALREGLVCAVVNWDVRLKTTEVGTITAKVPGKMKIRYGFGLELKSG